MSTKKNKHFAVQLAEQAQIHLTVQELTFITEAVKHGNVARAAAVAGWSPEKGYKALREDDRIKYLMDKAREAAFERSVLDISWIMDEAADLYHMAKHDGDIKAGISALTMIGKLSPVDAFAAQKVDVSGMDKVDRLRRGRQRASESSGEQSDDEVSFF